MAMNMQALDARLRAARARDEHRASLLSELANIRANAKQNLPYENKLFDLIQVLIEDL